MLLKKYCTESYTISEFMKLNNQDLNLIDKFLHELSKNKKEYAKLVFLLAIALPKPILGATNDMGLGDVAYEIIHMVLIFGKYGCLGIGLKRMIEEMIQGANLKEATSSGIQYFLFYIVLNLYPKLFSMVKF